MVAQRSLNMELNSGNIINADDDIGECLTANTEGTNDD